LTSSVSFSFATGSVVGQLTIRNANSTQEGVYSCAPAGVDQSERQFEGCLLVLGEAYLIYFCITQLMYCVSYFLR
jgi:hypothetical protein